MALTATASPSTRKDIIKMLGMKKPHVIVRCPNKHNIIYTVGKKSDDIDVVFEPFVEEVKRKRTKMDKVIIFCRSYNDLTDPPGYPNVAKFRIVDKFSASNSPGIKNQILSIFPFLMATYGLLSLL